MAAVWWKRTGANGDAKNGADGAERPHIIELREVVKTYETPAGDYPALKGIDLIVEPGEFVAVIGKSGSGKSTLINMITGADRPTSGEVLVNGVSLAHLNEGQLAEWRGRTVGIVFQFFQLLPTLTVLENVVLPMDFCSLYPGRRRWDRARELLRQVEIEEHALKLPTAVSGGQQQRVAIARALANDPPLVVADEPTGNLDSTTAESIFQLFEALVAQGKTIVVVTHDRDLATRATRTVILSDGQVVNEYLARAFPALSEEQLLAATRELAAESYPPAALILREGEIPDRFYIVTKGHVDVVIRGAGDEEVVVAQMHGGQYFGEIELVRGGANIASIRAGAQTGVEVVALDRDVFARLVAESAPVREAIDRVVQERIAENVGARQGEETGDL